MRLAINPKMRKQKTEELNAFQVVTTFLHEASHALLHRLDTDSDLGIDNKRITAVRDIRQYSEDLGEAGRYDVLTQLYNSMVPTAVRKKDIKRDDSVDLWVKYGARDPEEFITEVLSLITLSNNSRKGEARQSKLREVFRFLPEPIKNFVKAVFKTSSEMMRMARSVLPEEDHARFDQFEQDIKTILSIDPVEVEAKQALADVSKPISVAETDVGLSRTKFKKSGMKEVDDFVKRDSKYTGPSSFFRQLGSLQQMAHTPKMLTNFPTMRQVIDVLTRGGGEIKTKMNSMLASEMVKLEGGELVQLSSLKDSKLTKEQIWRKNARTRYRDHQQLRIGLSNAMRELNDQVNGQKLGTNFDSPEVQKHLDGLSPSDKDIARHLFDTRLEGSRKGADLIKSGYVEETVMLTAQIFQKQGMSNEQSEQLARASVNSMLEDKALPPAIANSEVGVLVEQFLGSQKEITRDTFSTLDRPFFSEMRMGKYNLRVDRKNGDKPVLMTANNEKELKALKNDIKKKGFDLVSTKTSKDFEFSEFDVVPSAVLQKMIGMSQNRIEAYEKLTGELVGEDFRLGANSVLSGLREELNERKSFLTQRKFADGREELDMVTSQDGYYSAVAASVTKRVDRSRVNFLLSSPEWSKDANLHQSMKSFTNELLNKPQITFQAFNKMVTVSKMGLNFSSALVDSTQNITMGIPMLAVDTTIAKATKYVALGYKEAFLPSKQQDPEFREMLLKAHNQQHLLTGAAFEESFNTSDVDAYNVARRADQKSLVSTREALTDKEFMWYKTTDLIKRWGQNLGSGAMTFTKVSAQINNKTTLYAAFRVGKDLGLKGDALYDYSLSKMQAVNIQGGRAASSAIKLTGSPKLNGYIESGTLLTKYPVAYISSMVGMYKSSLESSGLDQATRDKSKKIFATQLGISMAFSGVMGGTALGTIAAVIQQVTGVDIEGGIQENLAELGGPQMADILMNGIMNQTGIDFASRFKLGGVAGVSDFSGFESKDVFHAGGSFIESLIMAPEQIRNGDYSKVNLIPPGLRNMYTAIGKEGKVHNKSGKLVMDMDGADNFKYALGLRPTALSQKQKQLSMLRDIEQSNNKENMRNRVEYADRVSQGDFTQVTPLIEEAIQSELQQLAGAGMSQADLKTAKARLFKNEARKYINTALDREYETDVFDAGSGATAQQRGKIQSTFPYRAPRSMRAEREAKELELLSVATGKPVDRRTKTSRMLKMIDNLILENPALTRGQARQVAQTKISNSSRSGSYIEQDFR